MFDCVQLIMYQYDKMLCLSNYEYLKTNKQAIKSSALKTLYGKFSHLYSANFHMTNLRTDEMVFFAI